MTRRLQGFLLVLTAMLAVGCAAGQAFRQGNSATRAGSLDAAVAAYRRAVQSEPDNPTYAIALQRAMLASSRAHLERAREFENADQLEAALGEYKLASEYDPSNRVVLAKVAALEQTIRTRAEAARPRPAIQELRERAAAATAQPILNPASREPLDLNFPNTAVKDILNFIGNATGINITYDPQVANPALAVRLDGVTLEQALGQIMTMAQLSYKVVNERSIFVFPDTTQKHTQYDEQVIRTFYLSNADPQELGQLISTIIRIPGIAVQPAITPNRTNNTIVVRGTTAVVNILEKMIQQADRPRAEIVVDVEILEVDRNRSKSYGLNLSEYAIGTIFSPEVSPGATTSGTGTGTGTGTTTTTTSGRATAPSGVASPPPFNLNTISRGISTADFYLAVPTAIVRFLESDTRTRVIAKPQLRGAEGTKLTLKLGQRIPVVSTSYTPIATGGAGVNPLSSYTYQDVGVNIDMTPRVSLDGEILLDLTLDNSAVGADKAVAGVTVPTFVQRTVTTRLRLRDGEPNLLAGLLQQNDARSVQGFPGAIHLPLFRQLFSGNNVTAEQTEIVMLLTPHIVRTQEITEMDLRPIFIGSQQNLGVSGPPPLIAPPAPEPEPVAPPTPAPTPAPAPGTPGAPVPGTPRGTVPPVVPPGSTPVPGTVPAPPAQQPAPPAPAAGEPAPTPVQPQAAPPVPQSAAPAVELPITSPGLGSAQVLVSPPGTAWRVGGGPYTVPLSIVDAARISTITLTLVFDPARLRVRSVQEGSFMRAGGVDVMFAQQTAAGRVDITLARAADATGASGTGLLAAVLFDAVAPGSTTLTLSGTATGPGSTPMGLRFQPVTVAVQQ